MTGGGSFGLTGVRLGPHLVEWTSQRSKTIQFARPLRRNGLLRSERLKFTTRPPITAETRLKTIADQKEISDRSVWSSWLRGKDLTFDLWVMSSIPGSKQPAATAVCPAGSERHIIIPLGLPSADAA
jgi:hypothetical protein